MKNTLKKELPTFGLLALFTVLLFANILALEYFKIETPFEFDDDGLGILLLMFTTFLFLVMAVFGYRQYELKFQEKTSVAILLINNSLLILVIGFWLYELI